MFRFIIIILYFLGTRYNSIEQATQAMPSSMMYSVDQVWIPILGKLIIILVFNSFCSYVGIKQIMFGGTLLENWKENFNVEEAGCSIHKI